MSNDKLTVIDADYIVVADNGKPIKSDSLAAKNAVKSVSKSLWSMIIWTVKQVGSLMIDGISGTFEGIKEASESDTRRFEESRGRYNGPSRSMRNAKKVKRPIWYIPTKEEEEYERFNGGAYR